MFMEKALPVKINYYIFVPNILFSQNPTDITHLMRIYFKNKLLDSYFKNIEKTA